ncbi:MULTISPECIES: NrfD/PsrC family molybdoenzyme membrane anchor subunit [unclassified Adlercreutzia]|uniref:NrfD/PsrC family molybdoenzyme membrane anchor subunit n=1 Tax=unclassified Adlercreutzia TaxID=2636013 RepID=UPI0013EB0BFC|nr:MULTISPECIES: NrfD/PsrC family molybdoenzyme membrane anchor subunit [unclassified Adlercreutzia]
MFNALTIGYLFLGGVGAGLCVVLSVLECAAVCKPSRSCASAGFALPGDLFARGWTCCFVLLALGVTCLVSDVGRPDRLLGLFTSPHATALTVGSFALAATLVCSGALALALLLDAGGLSRAAVLGLSGTGAVAGMVTAAYTGVLLQSLPSVLAFRTPLIPVLFTLSSLSCGIACVFVIAAFTESRHPRLRPVFALARVDGVLILCEAAALAAFVLGALAGEGTRLGAQELIACDMAGYFWGGLVICGLAIPFAMERLLTYGNARVQLLWIAACLLAGGLSLRFCVVGLAAFDVTQMPGALFGVG